MQRGDGPLALTLQRHFVRLDASMLSKCLGHMQGIDCHIGR
jgi:hypothetical protein